MRILLPSHPGWWMTCTLGVALITIYAGHANAPRDDFRPINTQPSGQPLPPHVAVGRLSVPEGFQVTLSAAEPDVRQPIAISYDDRGRLWVAESYSYDGSDFTTERHDRVLILEDRDGDGVFDSRKIFASGLNRLTSIAWGFGGVWVTAAPHLLFIPDHDANDVPDGEPVVHLDGWTLKAEHNSVNGLTWGPDGWLYGRHGTKAPSRPGSPGVERADRPVVSCAIWRYHPTRHVFEVVADGTVNPWGLDFDDHGQMFMSTSVTDHLWHVVPGAHFKRTAGTLIHPHVYELLDSICDHSHRPRRLTVAGRDDDGGGGHAHVDAMIYLGDRWPEFYRGGVFLSNIMGQRLNHDRLVRDPGTGRFIATHGPDFLRARDPWFRSLSLLYGPDGDVVVTDWADHGECHDRDGVDRTSGRIYKISWGAPRRVPVNLEHASLDELVALQLHRNDWFVRHARRLLQERAHEGEDMTPVHSALRRMFDVEPEATRKLRAIWALHVTGGAGLDWLTEQLNHPEESVRYWAVRLLADSGPLPHSVLVRLVELSGRETAWLPRLSLASALATVDDQSRWEVGRNLAASARADDDPNLVRHLWAGWHPAVASRPEESLRLAVTLSSEPLQKWIARRLAEASVNDPALLAVLLDTVGATERATAANLIAGAEAGLTVHEQPLPGVWSKLRRHYDDSDEAHRQAALRLGAKLRDPAAIDGLRRNLLDAARTTAERTATLELLVDIGPGGILGDLLHLLDRRELLGAAIRALAAFDDPRIAPALLTSYAGLPADAQVAAISTLLSRPGSARQLLDAIADGSVTRDKISQFQAREFVGRADAALRQRFDEVWGRTNSSPEALRNRITGLRMTLKDRAFMADANLEAGRATFEQRCAACHTLFGRGGKLGPDLTGSGRKNLDYLLINVIDPNASITADWRLAIATLADGRVISGAVSVERHHEIVLQTAQGAATISRAQLQSLERLDTSLMPTGLVDDMSAQQVRDLFAFLMSDTGSP